MISKFSNKLPAGWIVTTLGEAAEIIMGQSPPGSATNENGIGIPLIGGASDFIDGQLNPSKYTAAPTKLCEKGDVILCIRATIGKASIADGEYCLGRGVAGIRSFVLNPSWILHYLWSSQSALESLGTGTTFKQIDKKKLSAFPFPVSPLNEHKRIITKIEELQIHSRRAREALETIPKLLEQVRRSIIAAAFRGDLTKSWRKDHSDVEPAAELLKRIRVERRKRWEQAELEKLKTKGLSGDKLETEFANQRKKYKEPVPVDTTTLGKLPDGWCWTNIGQLSDNLQYGSSAKSLKSGKIPVLRMGNLQEGEINWSDLVFTSNKEEIKKYELTPNTVLFNRTNSPELVGKTSIYRGEREALFAGYLIRINNVPQVLPSYLNLMLNSPFIKRHCLIVKSDAVSQSNINATKLAAFPIPLCSQEEQEKVVSLVEPILAETVNKLKWVKGVFGRLDELDQSILSKAFCGKIVSQNPNDEPANKLLERIREARSSLLEKPKKPLAGRKQKMKKITTDSVKEAIRHFTKDSFSFEELRENYTGKYDTLKDILFELLDEAEPIITQIFDQNAKEIRFIRRGK